MKPRALSFLPRTLVVCVAPLLACASTQAGVVSTNESNGSGDWTLPSGTNLLAGTAPLTVAATHEGSSPNWETVTDGTLGDVAGSPATSVTPNNGNTVTFPLDISGANAGGHNITSFDSYCTWANTGRDNQNYMLQYSTVADPGTFITITTVSLQTAADRSTHTRLTDNTGFLATGVHSIRLIFDRQENGFVGYREFVLQGTPAVVSVDNAARNDNTWPPLVGPNLLAGATASPATAATHEGSSDSWATLADGILGTPDTEGNAASVTPNNNDSVTFSLDLAAKPAGYDITSFESYCAWGSSGRDDQRYTLEYSTVGAPETFLPITEVYNHTEWTGGFDSGRKSTRTRVTANGGPLALGVAAIRVTFHDQENGFTGFREFVLRDTPLPTTIVNESNATNIWTLPTGTNLLSNTLEKSPPFAENSNHGNNDVTNSDWSILTDGSVGSAGVQLESVAPLNNTSVVFPLDTSVNFNGYNLTSLDTYCAWGDSGRDDQNYTVSYSTVTDPEVFIPIETVSNKTFSPINSTHTRIASTPGFLLAANVGAVKFDFANQENGWTGFREFVALGSAVPLSPPLTWAGLSGSGGSATWITGPDDNWTNGGVGAPYNSLAPLTFDNTGTNTEISIPVSLTANSLTFSNDNTHPYGFSQEMLTVTNGVTVAGSGSVTFANPLQAAGLAVTGAGSLTLSVDNTLTGSSTVSNGTLRVASDLGLGLSSLTLAGGTVEFTSAVPIVSSIGGTGGVILLGDAAASSHTDLYVGASVSSSYAGSIADADTPGSATGSLIKAGSGSLTLTGANSYSGTTSVIDGELKLGKRLSLYNGDTNLWTAANILVETAISLRVGGAGEFTGSDVAALDTGGFGAAAVLGLDTTSGNAGISNVIASDVKLEKNGLNTLQLSGTNTFTQGITVTQGALEAANPGGISIPSNLTVGDVTFDAYVNMAFDNQFGPDSLIRFNTGAGAVTGKVQLRGTSQTVAGLESTPTGGRLVYIQNDETTAPSYTTNPGPATLTINTATESFHSFHGVIRNRDGDSLSLVKAGLGTQEFVNSVLESYSYNGITSINQGTLRLNFFGNNSGFGSNVTVAAPGTLEFYAVGSDHNFERNIAGEGHVFVNGTSAVRFFDNNNSWSGGTTVGVVDDIYRGFLALVGNGTAGEGTGPGQNCAAGAMIPSNLISVENGATLALDGIAPLGNSGMLPQFAPSVRITENSRLYGGSVSFVPNLTLNGGSVEITSGSDAGGFGTNLAFVGTVIVSGNSIVPAEIVYAGGATGPFANVSLGSLGLPGTTFQVADVTLDTATDLAVSAILRNVGSSVSPLTKTGPGTMSLEGANTYTGTTTVSGGELTVNGASIVDANKVVLDGGKLGLVADETVGSLSFGGVIQNAGTYGSTDSDAANKDNSRFSGTGILTVVAGPAVAYETWALVIPTEGDRDRTDDPDGDGFTNLDEFLFGTSPIAGNGSLSTVEETNDGLIVRWNERANSNSVYVLEESMTLQTPWPASTATVSDNLVQDLPNYVRKQAVVPIDNNSKFVRVKATE